MREEGLKSVQSAQEEQSEESADELFSNLDTRVPRLVLEWLNGTPTKREEVRSQMKTSG